MLMMVVAVLDRASINNNGVAFTAPGHSRGDYGAPTFTVLDLDRHGSRYRISSPVKGPVTNLQGYTCVCTHDRRPTLAYSFLCIVVLYVQYSVIPIGYGTIRLCC